MTEFVWGEKYRPKTIDECILPISLKKTFKEIRDTGSIPNMLLTGTAGLGKTTVAKALCNELGLDYLMINASDEGNIDTLRGKIKQFATTVSLHGGHKVVILDEADYLNAQSTQPALRGAMESYSNNCRFILTANFKNRIIAPLHSRCSVYEFNTSKKDMSKLAAEFFERMKFILDSENVEYDEKVIVDLIIKHAPDWRRVINECQRYSLSGKIDAGILENVSDASYDVLFKALKEKNFKEMRKWVVNNIDAEPASIFRGIYDRMYDKVDPKSIPSLVLILADYQYKQAFVVDGEVNLVACMIEIMTNVQMKG